MKLSRAFQDGCMACQLLPFFNTAWLVNARSGEANRRWWVTIQMKTILSGILSVFIALFLAPLANVSRAADTFIGFNDLWFYSDHGIDRGTEWRNATFEYYFEWPIGIAEMGFGEGDEFTEINSAPGGVPLNTAYFVTTFTVG